MFDPPDFPYREFSDTLPEPYDTNDLLMTGHAETAANNNRVSTAKSLAEITELMISNVENQLSFTTNETGSYFNIDTKSFLNTSQANIENNTTLYTIQPADNLFNYEPTLLDENTVNQFLLPLQTSDVKNEDPENNGPDILSLHSCVVCHDIFTTDSDLLDHTVLVHASVDAFQQNADTIPKQQEVEDTPKTTDAPSNEFNIDAEWLVCSTCSRVLSTALEIGPSEQLCCIDGEGKGGVTTRKLHTMFVCDYCCGLFADEDALNGHTTTCFAQDSQIFSNDIEDSPSLLPSRPEVYFPCNTCSKQYPTAEELKAHLLECQRPTRRRERHAYNTANRNKMWNCGSCNQLFSTARELYKHKRGEDRPSGMPLMIYVCEECDKVLGSMCALHTHKKMHKVSKPGYPCRVCGRRFNQSGHLAIHMRMHTGERPYPCDLCPKAFKVKVERDDHRRTHTGERPFACAACPKTFTAAARLREHARIHTDQRPYSCEICGAAFRRPYARTVHTLIHTGEKPHECDVCGTAFRRSGDMWKHKRTLHGIQAQDA